MDDKKCYNIDVPWFKFPTNMFNNPAIILMQAEENGDSMVLLWIRLLNLFAQEASTGTLYMRGTKIPYTPDDLPKILRCNPDVIKAMLDIAQKYEMILIDGDLITIPNWLEYLDVKGMAERKEADAERKREERKRRKQSESGHQNRPRKDSKEIKPSPSDPMTPTDAEAPVGCQEVIDLYNGICQFQPRTKNTVKRQAAVQALIDNGFTRSMFIEMFTKVKGSPFLRGEIKKFKASIDWLLKPTNAEKVLGGDYDEWENPPHPASQGLPDYDNCKGESF
ncbi:MAG: hypothetical protein HFE44_16800 [Oscillospiraceae bacterium]|nr:hypothetical protein [Oscillospiraceae bacterium]